MRNVTIKGLLAHKLRLALTALAIVLGVAFISGTFVLTDTLNNTFSVLFGNIYQKIDFQVRGVAQLGSGANATRNQLPESLLATVRSVPGVQAAEGQVTGYAQFVTHDGKAIQTGGAPTLAVSFDPDQQISSLHLVAGGPPVTSDDVVMDAGTACQVRLQRRAAGPHPVGRAHPDVHHHRHRPVRVGEQPRRSDPGRVHAPDRAGHRPGDGQAR